MATKENRDAAITDHALVIGIARYPNLGAKGTANDLGGPVFDALAVAKWLVNDAGVPPQNVTCVTSAGIHDISNSQLISWPDDDVRPRRDDIEWPLYRKVRDSLLGQHNGPAAQPARRIWIYGAGHGFTPASDMSDIALLMSDALERGYVPNLAITKFANWLTQFQAFREVVLWLDCCAETRFAQSVGEPFLPNSSFNPQLPKWFYVIAAPTGRLAYEDQSQNPPQGIFTKRLLSALRGDARVSATGHITSEAIREFFKNTGAPPPGSTAVVPEPEVTRFTPMNLVHLGVSATPAMAPSASTYTLHLGLPAGTAVEILGAKLQTLYQLPVGQNGGVQVQLAAGLYCVKDAGTYRKLFQIEPGAPLEVRVGVALSSPRTLTATHSARRWILLVSNEGSETFVVGGDFALVARGGQELRTPDLPDGLYKLKVLWSGQMVESIVEFPADGTTFVLRVEKVQTTLPNNAEFGGDMAEIQRFEQSVKTVLQKKTHIKAETSAAVKGGVEGPENPLAVPFQQSPANPTRGRTALVLAAGVEKGMQDVFSTLRVVAATSSDHSVKMIDAKSLATLELDNQNFRVGQVPLRHGVHTLSADIDGMTVTMAIPLVQGRQTRVFARRRHVTSSSGQRWMEGVDLSVQLCSPGTEFVLGADDLSEVIRIALTNGRRIIIKGDLVNRMLNAKYKDPLVGIAGAHLMLAALERMDRPSGYSMAPTPDFDTNDVETVLQNMRRPAALGRNADIAHEGQVLPDIVALYTRAGLMGKRLLRVTQAPLYWESWRVLLKDGSQHAVLDPFLRDAARHAFAWGPYLVFSRPQAD